MVSHCICAFPNELSTSIKSKGPFLIEAVGHNVFSPIPSTSLVSMMRSPCSCSLVNSYGKVNYVSIQIPCLTTQYHHTALYC